jgi:GNAT superfamily N-acetyltransferase
MRSGMGVVGAIARGYAPTNRLVGSVPRTMAMRLRPIGQPGDLGWVVQRHGELYAQQFGWDGGFEALVAQIVADFAGGHDARREAAWIAELEGRRAGCVFCVARDADADVAQLRILLVEPFARGRGVGTALVGACVDFARAAGHRELVLWTNHPLVAARRIYDVAGFRLVAEEPHHSFGHDLVGQHLALDLRQK